MKITNPACLFLLLLFSFYSFNAFGQCWRVHYCKGCVDSRNCDEYRDFDNESDANTSLRAACATGGYVEHLSNCGSQPAPRPITLKSPGANGFYGALLGGLLGSLGKDPNGKLLWDLGAAGGFAFFSGITIIAEPKSRPMGTNIVLGTLVCASTAYACVRAGPLISKSDTPKSSEEVTKESVKAAVIAGGGGAVLGIIFSKKPTKGTSYFRKKNSGLLANTSFQFSGNRIGLIIRL